MSSVCMQHGARGRTEPGPGCTIAPNLYRGGQALDPRSSLQPPPTHPWHKVVLRQGVKGLRMAQIEAACGSNQQRDGKDRFAHPCAKLF